MHRLVLRTCIALLAGAGAGAAAVAALYGLVPAISIEMDREPVAMQGVYPVERAGQDTWAWTGRQAALKLPGLDRRVPWTCAVRVRGGRSDVKTLPQITLSVDGIIVATYQTTNDYQDVLTTLPSRPTGRGAIVTLTSSSTVQPGPSDTRNLGVMIDRWVCRPDDGTVSPPRQTWLAAAVGGAAFAVAASLIGMGLVATVTVAIVLALGQAVPLTWELGAFTPYIARVPWVALWIAGLLVVGVRACEWRLGRRCHAAAQFVAIFALAVLYLKLLALLHPSKTPVDVVFNAHRLMWVLDGRFFFTQPMPSGVQFPYAIGMYVFAAPWTILTRDYVLLLRIIVSAAEASGGILLYLLVSRCWNDRLAGAFAAVLVSVLPRAFEIVGNANMTNAFGQSVALGVVAVAVLWRLGSRDWWQIAAFTALTAFALLCHISTFALLSAIVSVLAALYWWRGSGELRGPAARIFVALVVAAVFSIVVYYGHFGDAFVSAAQVRATASASSRSAPPEARMAFAAKAVEAARLSVAAVGWPQAVLAVFGAVAWWRRGLRDRLSLAVAAWIIIYVVFVTGVVAAPVGASFLRYAAEFITRVTLATAPAVVILAATGAAEACRRGGLWRVSAIAVLAFALHGGIQLWMDWLR